MCKCKENNYVRLWEETHGGKYPKSIHSPRCPEYKQINYKEVKYHGSSFITDIEGWLEFMDIVKYDYDAEDYEYSDVYLTKDQYDNLVEFEGF